MNKHSRAVDFPWNETNFDRYVTDNAMTNVRDSLSIP